jgi:ATP-binding cassette subfamily F protein 3
MVKPFEGGRLCPVRPRPKQARRREAQPQKEERPPVAPRAKPQAKKGGPSSTLRHAVKKAEERVAALTAEIARIDDDLANAAVPTPRPGIYPPAWAPSRLDAAEAAWMAAERLCRVMA